MGALLRTSEDALTEETTSYGWDDGAKMSSKKYLGTYVLTEKNHGDNKVFVVYEVTADFNYEGQTDSCTYYTYVQFSDVVINDEGEISCDTSYHYRPSSFTYKSSIKRSRYWTETYYLHGFQTITQLNDDIVTGNLSRYDSDTNVSQNMSSAPAEDTEASEETEED
jgi:hypothetical protein